MRNAFKLYLHAYPVLFRYNEERVKELESKIRNLEMDLNAEEQKKESARHHFQDFVRRLSVALGTELSDYAHTSPETLVHKATELVQVGKHVKSRISVHFFWELGVKTIKILSNYRIYLRILPFSFIVQ